MVSWMPRRVAVPISPTALAADPADQTRSEGFDLRTHVVGADPELPQPG